MADALIIERAGARATLVLNRPQARNAITRAMWDALPARLAELAADPALRVLIVAGAGGTFSAGADIDELAGFAGRPRAAAAYHDAMAAALEALARVPVPVIARIEGACVGAGCAVALACDVRIAAAGARLGITPGKLGLVYPLADMARLTAQVGPSAAKDLLFSGRLVEAEAARGIGLVNAVVPDTACADAVRARAEAYAAGAPSSARIHKAHLTAPPNPANARAAFIAAFQGPDFAEGRAAFAARRAPRFSAPGARDPGD